MLGPPVSVTDSRLTPVQAHEAWVPSSIKPFSRSALEDGVQQEVGDSLPPVDDLLGHGTLSARCPV